MVGVTDHEIVVDKEFQTLIPPLSPEQRTAFVKKELGFEGESPDWKQFAKLIPTPLSPHYWIWTIADLDIQIEEYSPKATACSRIPWRRFHDIRFVPVAMECVWEYPPPHTSESTKRQLKHLYILQPVIGGPVKVGASQAPNARVEQLQTGCPFPLRVIRIYRGQGGLEALAHGVLKDRRLHGEWFDPSAIRIVDNLVKKGGQDVQS